MKILDCIEKEVDGLTEQACRKWLKMYKQAMFLIHGKLYRENSGILQCFSDGEESIETTNRINTSIQAKVELSKDIAKVMDEYKIYAKDVLGTFNSSTDNLKQWVEYFEDRNLLKHAEEIKKLIVERAKETEDIVESLINGKD